MRALIICFLALITLPTIMDVAGLRFADRIPNSEHRVKSKMPKLDLANISKYPLSAQINKLKEYTTKFEKYVNDGLVTRTPLLDLQKVLRVDMLGSSPVPDKVVIGDDGWLFLGEQFGDIIEESTGLKYATEDELATLVRNAIDTKKVLNKLGIDYYLCIAPNKHTVYSDKLPIQKNGPTILDQFKSAIGNQINFVDLKDDYYLMPDKMLFNKSNTHFTDIGALISSQTLLRKMKTKYRSLSVPKYTDYTESISNPQTDELTRMLRINGTVDKYLLTKNEISTTRFAASRLTVSSTYRGPPSTYEARFKNDGKPLKVLVCGDSFMGVMRKFLKESFGEVTFLNENKLNMEVILEDKPDVVVQEIVERGFDLILGFQY